MSLQTLARRRLIVLTLTSALALAAVYGGSVRMAPALSAKNADPSYKSAVVYRNVMVPMRDGVRLATDVYLPSHDGATPAPGTFPVLISRTIYNKSGGGGASDFLQHGYAVALQDVRGAYASEGRPARPMLDEGWGEHSDGYDTAAWLRKQPWSNGQVGAYGASYMGGTTMGIVLTKTPGLVAAVAQVTATDQFSNNWVFVDGALDLLTALPWSISTRAADTASHAGADTARLIRSDLQQFYGDTAERTGAPMQKMLRTLPLRDVPGVRHMPFWNEWLDNWERPWFFRANDTRDHMQNAQVPVVHWGGWYDLFLRNTYDLYEGISQRAASADARANQRLVIGPWTHGPCAECVAMPNSGIDSQGYAVAWMNRWFKNVANPVLEHPVLLYVMGENRWRAEEAWPLPGTRITRYYLHSGGRANGADGDGALSVEMPGSEPADRYTYDPNDPVPTRGGHSVTGGRAERSDLERRADTLIFSTPVLTEDVEVTGEIRATLYAASSARDTDWWVKLVDVEPDGRVYNLHEGVVRARYRFSRTEPQPLTPGAIEAYRLDLSATSNVFKKGHRIRVEVTSSDFPRTDRHPNVYQDLTRVTEKDFVVARQTVYHDAQHPSSIDLPIIPAARGRRWIETPFPGPDRREFSTRRTTPPQAFTELPAAQLPR